MSHYLTQPSGKVRYESYPREEHEEEEVRRFAVRIENEVAEENTFRRQLKRLIAEAEVELGEAQNDTESHEAARLRLAEVSKQQQKDKRVAEARSELEAARERWHAVSGRRPH